MAVRGLTTVRLGVARSLGRVVAAPASSAGASYAAASVRAGGAGVCAGSTARQRAAAYICRAAAVTAAPQAARQFSTAGDAPTAGAAAGGGPAASPEARERMNALVEEIAAQVEAALADMRKKYGEAHTEKVSHFVALHRADSLPRSLQAMQGLMERLLMRCDRIDADTAPQYMQPSVVQLWMTDYYRHRDHKFLAPAVALMCGDGGGTGAGGGPAMPSLVAKNAVFLSYVLRDVPAEQAVQQTATLTMTRGVDVSLLLAVLRRAGTQQAGAMYDRMATSIRRMGNKELVAAGQAVAAAPVLPVEEWPIPFLDSTFAADWKSKTHPFEAIGACLVERCLMHTLRAAIL